MRVGGLIQKDIVKWNTLGLGMEEKVKPSERERQKQTKEQGEKEGGRGWKRSEKGGGGE